MGSGPGARALVVGSRVISGKGGLTSRQEFVELVGRALPGDLILDIDSSEDQP